MRWPCTLNPREWTGAETILVIIAGFGLALIGLFLLELSRHIRENEKFLSDDVNPEIVERRESLIANIQTAAVGAASGVTTAIIFLVVYRLVDFNILEDISERFVGRLCSIEQPPPDTIIWPYPPTISLIPEFIILGLAAGLITAITLKPWEKLLFSWFGQSRVAWLSGRVGSCMTFGIFWGFFLGGIFNTVFFSISDGRPFMSLKTAVMASVASILLYVGMLHAVGRKNYSEEVLNGFVILVATCLVIAIVGVYIDRAVGLTEWAYCHFYEAWDTKRDQLQTNFNVWLIASLYGAYIGALVMAVVAGYLWVAAIYKAERKK